MELRWDIRSVLSDNDSGSLDLSPEQWDLAKALLPVLWDLEEAARELSGEKYMTLSMVLPILHVLHAELLPAAGDKAAVRTLKSGLRSNYQRVSS